MNDLRCAFRSLAKSPGFTLVAVVSLAIGIGVNTTIFSAMDAAFLRPLPLSRPDEIVKFERPLLSFAEFEQIRTALRSADLTASLRQNFLLRSPEGSALVTGRLVTANYFAVLGVKPTLGRFFGAQSADLGEPIKLGEPA